MILLKKLSRKSRVGIIILAVLLSLVVGAWALWQGFSYYCFWELSIHGFNRYADDFQVMADVILEHEEEINQYDRPWLSAGGSGAEAYMKIKTGPYLPLTDEEKEHVENANKAFHAGTGHDMNFIELKENEVWFGTELRGYYVVYTKDGKWPDYSNDPGFDNKEVSVRKNSAHWYEVMADYKH